MALVCPNKNNPDWIKLINSVGENQAYKIFIANNNEIPTSDKVNDLIVFSNKSRLAVNDFLEKYGDTQEYIESSNYLNSFLVDNNIKYDTAYTHSEVLKKIGRPKDSITKAILKILEGPFSKLDVKVKFTDMIDRGSANYDWSTNTITLPLVNLSIGYTRRKFSGELNKDVSPEYWLRSVFIHESIHAFTSLKLAFFEGRTNKYIPNEIFESILSITEEDTKIFTQLNNLLKYAQEQAKLLNVEDYYGLTSVHEFIAEAFADEEFIQFLGTLKLPENSEYDPNSNVFMAFIKYILQLLGFQRSYPTLFEEIIDLTIKLGKDYNPQVINKASNSIQEVISLFSLVQSEGAASEYKKDKSEQSVAGHNRALFKYLSEIIDKEDIPKGSKNKVNNRQKADPNRERDDIAYNEYVWAVENSLKMITWDVKADPKLKYYNTYDQSKFSRLNDLLKKAGLENLVVIQWNEDRGIARVELKPGAITELESKFPRNEIIPKSSTKDTPQQLELGLFRKVKSSKVLEERIKEAEQDKDEAHANFARNMQYVPQTEAEKIFESLYNALKRRRKIIERSGRVVALASTDAFLKQLIEEEDYNKRIIMIVERAWKEIEDIKKEYKNIIESNVDSVKLNPSILARWKNYLSTYDDLDGYLPYLKLRGETFSDEQGKDLSELLRNVVEAKNGLKQLYKTEGIDMMVNFLAPNYHMFVAKARLEARKRYQKEIARIKSENKFHTDKEAIEKFGMTREQYVDDYLESNKVAIENETKTFIRKELDEASKDINVLYRWVDNLLDSRDPVVSAMVAKYSEVHHTARLQAIEKRNELLSIIKELESQATYKGWNLQKIYDFMLEKDDDGNYTGHYVTNFKSKMLDDYYEFREFCKSLDIVDIPEAKHLSLMLKVWKDGVNNLNDYEGDLFEALYAKHEKAFDENKKFKDMIRNFGNAPLNRTRFYNDLDIHIAILEGKGIITRDEYLKLKINSKRQFTSRKTFWQMAEDGDITEDTAELIQQWVMNNSWDYRQPIPEYQNLEFNKLSKILENIDDPRAKLYKYVKELAKQSNAKLPARFRLGTRLPGVVKTTGERITESQSPLVMFQQTFVHNFLNRPEDDDRGLIDESQKDQEKDAKFFLPIYYTNKPELKDQSFDIPTIYLKFWDMANSFQLKSQILPEMEMAKTFVEDRKIVLNPKRTEAEEKRYKSKNYIAEQLNDWFLAVIYGKSRIEGKTIKVLGREINIERTLDAINKYTAFNLLGMNFVQGTANIILGESLQTLEALAMEHISRESFVKGTAFYSKYLPQVLGEIGNRRPSSTLGMLIEHFDILNDYYAPEFRKNNKFRQLMQSDTLFFTSHAGEHFMQGSMLMAFLQNKKAYDENGSLLGSMLEMYEKGEKEYKQKLKDKYKDNWHKHYEAKLRLPDNVDLVKSKWTTGEPLKDGTPTINHQEEFRRKVAGILSRIHGEYSDLGKVAVQRYALGRMAYMFRKFVIPGFKRRWEGSLTEGWDISDYSERLQDFQEGNYITMTRFLKNMFKDMNFLKLSMWSENWNEMDDHQRANVVRTLGELVFLISAILLANMFLRLEGEADDDNEELLLAFWAYQFWRFKAELLFFVNPKDAFAILRSPMASMSVIENFGELFAQMFHPFEKYEKGPWKDKLKLWKEFNDMIPVRRQLLRLNTLGNTINWFR